MDALLPLFSPRSYSVVLPSPITAQAVLFLGGGRGGGSLAVAGTFVYSETPLNPQAAENISYYYGGP